MSYNDFNNNDHSENSHSDNNRRSNIIKTIFGIILLAIGIAYLGQVLKFWSLEGFSFNGWWTLFIFIPAIYSIIDNGIKVGNIIALSIATLLLLCAQEVIDWNDMWKILVSIFAITIGLSLIFKKQFSEKSKHYFATHHGDKYEYTAVFSGNNLKVSPNFTAGQFQAVFGGLEIDLRDVEGNEDIYLDCGAVFGGIDIYAPDGYSIEMSVTPIFGEASDKTNSRNRENYGHVVYIKGYVLFGGIEIK